MPKIIHEPVHIESFSDYQTYVTEHRQKERYYSAHVDKITLAKLPDPGANQRRRP